MNEVSFQIACNLTLGSVFDKWMVIQNGQDTVIPCRDLEVCIR